MPFRPDRVVASSLATGNPPNERIEITSQGGGSRIEFYTADPAEIDPGRIYADVDVPAPDPNRRGRLWLESPDLGTGNATMTLLSESPGGLPIEASARFDAGGAVLEVSPAGNVFDGPSGSFIRAQTGQLDLQATVGNVNISAGNTATMFGPDVTITATDDITVDAVDRLALEGQAITLNSTGSNVQITAAVDVTLQAVDDIFLVAEDQIQLTSNTQDVRLVGADDVVLSAGDALSGTGVTLVQWVATNGSVGIGANNGDISLVASDDIILSAVDDITATGSDFFDNTTRHWRNGVKQPIIAYGVVSGNTDGTGDFTINHGLPGTPTVVNPQPASQFQFMVPYTIGATQFKVRVSNSAGAALPGTASTCYWMAFYDTP